MNDYTMFVNNVSSEPHGLCMNDYTMFVLTMFHTEPHGLWMITQC